MFMQVRVGATLCNNTTAATTQQRRSNDAATTHEKLWDISINPNMLKMKTCRFFGKLKLKYTIPLWMLIFLRGFWPIPDSLHFMYGPRMETVLNMRSMVSMIIVQCTVSFPSPVPHHALAPKPMCLEKCCRLSLRQSYENKLDWGN